MKNKKRIFPRVMIVLVMLLSLSVSSMAAWVAVGGSAGNSRLLAAKTCKFTSLKTNYVTVVNNGTVNMLVYIDGIYRTELKPGREYNYREYGWKLGGKQANVKVYTKRSDALGRTQEVVIKTNNGTIR